MPKYKPFQNDSVKTKFDFYPKNIQQKLLIVRQLIFDVAADMPEVGELEETLKWGEPSYVTSQTNSGSTIRIDWKKTTPDHYYIYFNCKTTLVDTFKEIHGKIFTYGGNRSLIFHKDDKLLIDELSDCIAMALTYRLAKNGKPKSKLNNLRPHLNTIVSNPEDIEHTDWSSEWSKGRDL